MVQWVRRAVVVLVVVGWLVLALLLIQSLKMCHSPWFRLEALWQHLPATHDVFYSCRPSGLQLLPGGLGPWGPEEWPPTSRTAHWLPLLKFGPPHTARICRCLFQWCGGQGICLAEEGHREYLWWDRAGASLCPPPPSGKAWSELGLSLIHISEPTRLGMISYAVFCLKKKK